MLEFLNSRGKELNQAFAIAGKTGFYDLGRELLVADLNCNRIAESNAQRQSAVCHGLLQGWSPHRIIEFASAAGALATMHIECASIMPTAPEVEALLAAHPEATAGLEVWSRSTPAAPASPTIGSELP